MRCLLLYCWIYTSLLSLWFTFILSPCHQFEQGVGGVLLDKQMRIVGRSGYLEAWEVHYMFLFTVRLHLPRVWVTRKSKDDIVSSITIFFILLVWETGLYILQTSHYWQEPSLITSTHPGNTRTDWSLLSLFFYPLFLFTNLLCVSLLPPQSGFLRGRQLSSPIAFSIVLGKPFLTPRRCWIECKWILGAFCILILRVAHSKEQSAGEKFGLSYERAGTCI